MTTKYVINFTDSTVAPIVIMENNVDTSTDITLFGKNELQYGASVNQNLLSLLEKFSCPEDADNPGYPNTVLSQGKLVNPILGQFWYNSTKETLSIWNGTTWSNLLTDTSMVVNWGTITNGNQIPQPIDSDGNAFAYINCAWIVSPCVMNGVMDSFTLDTDTSGNVTFSYTVIGDSTTYYDGVANYLIVGIKNNTNNGTLFPIITPSPTPTLSVTPSVTPISTHLDSGLISYWEFENNSMSSVDLDSQGINAFTRHGTVTSISGKILNAIQPDVTTYLSVDPATNGMAIGNNANYTFGGWFKKPSTFSSYAPIFQRGVIGESQNRSFHLQYTLGTDNLTLAKSHNGVSLETVSTANNIGLVDNGWHFIVAWVDGSHLTLNVQVDNGVIYTESMNYSATWNVGTLMLGSSSFIPLQFAVDQLFYYNRVLSAVERTMLYNGGNGLSYAQVAGLGSPSPTPTQTITPTPSLTPSYAPLAVVISGTHTAYGSGLASGPVTTNTITGIAYNGTAPYAYEWIYMVPTGTQPTGEMATPTTPTSSSTTFSRTESAGTYYGYYRLKVTDNMGSVVYSAPVLVETVHT